MHTPVQLCIQVCAHYRACLSACNPPVYPQTTQPACRPAAPPILLAPAPPLDPQTLTPQMSENKRRAEELLREAYTLCEALQRRAGAGVLEKLLPKRHKQFAKGIAGRA